MEASDVGPGGTWPSDMRRKRHAIELHNSFSTEKGVHDETREEDGEATRIIGVLLKL